MTHQCLRISHLIIRKGREGLGRCYLCKMEAETNAHLGVDCLFTRQVWMDFAVKLKLMNLWSGDSVLSCLQNWCLNEQVKHIRSLTVIVFWSI